MNKKHFRGMTLTSLAAVMLVAVSASQASVIQFDNPPGPDHFNWAPPNEGDSVVLNIRFGPLNQGLAITARGSMAQTWTPQSTDVDIGSSPITQNRIETFFWPGGTQYV